MDKRTIEDHFRGDYQPFYARYLPDLKKGSDDQMKAAYPFHEDNNPSLSVQISTGLFKCFGCEASVLAAVKSVPEMAGVVL